MSQIVLDEKFIAQATCLTNYEAAQKLAGTVESQNDLIDGAKNYAQEFSQVSSDSDLNSIKANLSESGYKEYEIVTLVNLLPGTPEEAKAFCPTLQSKSDENISEAINFIRSIIRL